MKCIRAIKGTKDVVLGEVRRVDDKTAYNMVGSSWEYVPKSEWKKQVRVTNEEEKSIENKQNKKEQKKKKHG
jgi:hypothetical protein